MTEASRDAGGRAGGADEPVAGDAELFVDEAAGDGKTIAEDADSADAGDELPARRTWIRNTVAVLLVAALLANILALLPRIYNMETLPLLHQSRELSGREAVAHARDAVVLIVTDRGRGSGFHVSGGYIVTNHHVIEDAAYAIVEFPGIGLRFAAEVTASDPELDAAVLRVDAGGARLPSIEIERDREWEPGERVYVIGHPLYLEQIAGEGTILGTVPVRGRSRPVMAVDAPVHKGNSGSPVINSHGRAIAVIYATGEIRHRGEPARAGFAVPLRDLDALLPEPEPESPPGS